MTNIGEGFAIFGLLCFVLIIMVILIAIFAYVKEFFGKIMRYSKDQWVHQAKDKEISDLKAKIVVLENKIAMLSAPYQGPYKTLTSIDVIKEIDSQIEEIEEDNSYLRIKEI